MTRFTLAQLRTQIQDELDIQDEVFVTAAEVTKYINDALDEAEKELFLLKGDYFLTSTNIALVSGTSKYALPSDIYAQKIRGLIYNNGSLVYNITKVKDWHKFEEISLTQTFGNSNYYKYSIRHESSALDYQLVLYPTPQETSATNVTINYIRNALRLSSDSDYCDMPEALQFIKAHTKMNILAKEMGGVAPQEATDEMERQKQLWLAVVAIQTPDNEDDVVEADFSAYEEFN